MRRFKEGEQIYTAQQVQMDPEEDEIYADEEELDLTRHNRDYVELQNYLSAIGKWRSTNLLNSGFDEVQRIAKNEEIQIPDFHDFVNNSSLLGKAIKDLTYQAHNEEISKVNAEESTKLLEAKADIPSYMPLKLLILGEEFEGIKEIQDKLAAEFHLKIFDIKTVTKEVEKLLNPPQEEEIPDPKKAKGKQVQEEPAENAEEVKEISKVVEKIRKYREDHPGLQTIAEDHLMEILAIKIKYAFESKTDQEILKEIKEGIKQDIFRPAEEEVDPKKAKGKGPSKEELEEELTKYKKVQPSGYLILNLPQTVDTILWYEKIINGYSALSEKQQTHYESSISTSQKLFPCPLSEQSPYILESSNNYLLHRSLTLTAPIVDQKLKKNQVVILEKDSPKDLEQKFAVVDPDFSPFKNL